MSAAAADLPPEGLEILFNRIDEGLAVVEMIYDDRGDIIDMIFRKTNEAYERQGGVFNVVGRSVLDVLPGVEEHWLRPYRDVAKTGVAERVENYQQDLDRWFDVYFSRLDEAGRFVAVVFNDITERKRTELALRKSEKGLRRLLDGMGEGYGVIAPDFTILEHNREAMRMDGRSREDVVGRSHWEAFPGSEHSEVGRLLKQAMAERKPVSLEHRYAWEDGHARWLEMRAYPTDDGALAVFWRDVTDRLEALEALRESEKRQVFLLKLSDALRAEPDADAVAYRGINMVLERLKLDRCYLASYRLADDRADITHQVGTNGVPEMPSEIRLSDFPEAFREVFDQTLVVDDVKRTKGISETDRQNMAALGFGSLVAPTLRRGERKPVWVLVAVSSLPRVWSAGEIAMLEEAAERIWAAMKRAAAETALRDSEERFRQFAAASSGALWIRDARTLDLEYVSPASEAIYGVPPEGIFGDIKRWAALIVPDDRESALEHIEEARRGNPVVHEFRIQRPDGRFRWIRNTDFPLLDADGKVERVGGIAEDVTEAKQAVEHQGVLLHELQHRVRNIMGVLRSVANRSASGPENVEDYRAILDGRLLAIARVQALLTREANAGGSMRDILHAEISAMAHGSNEVSLSGPDVTLSPKAVEVLSLAFHELATNALKYGAFSGPDGRLSVTWLPFEKRGSRWLAVDWVEQGAPGRAPSGRRGFGSELIESRIPYELGGTGTVSIGPGGATCRLEFPLAYAESILETDAPSSAIVFGGTLDMTGAPDLSGQRILVVEDDYYAASDTAAALRGAGAEAVGPCPTEEATLKLLESEQPTAAVVDLNLGGGGPRFNVALALKDRGIPFVFLTGYSPDVIPDELEDIVRLQKPIPLRGIIEAVAALNG